MARKRFSGFSLVEILIAMAVLGILAVFTVPKVLQNSQDNDNATKVKAAARMVGEAMMTAKLNNPNLADINELSPYLNYVKLDATGAIDDVYGGSLACSTGFRCFRLMNGATIGWWDAFAWVGKGNLSAVFFFIDPDGKDTSDGRSVQFWLYYSGKLRTLQTGEPNTCMYGSCTYAPNPWGGDPDWLNWGT